MASLENMTICYTILIVLLSMHLTMANMDGKLVAISSRVDFQVEIKFSIFK